MKADPHHKGLYLTEAHRWVFRRVIPAVLRPAAKRMFNVAAEFQIALATHQRDEAVSRLPEARAEVDRRMALLRQEVEAANEATAPKVGPEETRTPDLRTILGLAPTKAHLLPAVDHALVLAGLDRWHQEELFRINRSILNGEYPNPRAADHAYQAAADQRYRRIEQLQRYDPRLHRDPDATVPDFSRALFAVLDSLGFAVPVSHAGLHPVRIAFREAWLDILRRESRWLTAYHYEHPPRPVPRPPFRWDDNREPVAIEEPSAATPPPSPPAPTAAPPSIRFTELVAYYRQKTKAKEEDVRVVERRFLDTIGDDKPISEITEQDIIAFRNHLENIPAYLPRGERMGVPLPLLAAKYGPRVQEAVRLLRVGEHHAGDSVWHDDDLPETAEQVRPLADASIEKQLNCLKGMFKRARTDRLVEKNVAAEVDIIRRGVETQRLPLGPEDITALFSGPIYTGMRSTKVFWEPGNIVVGNSSFWLPLLALFTGMRLEEMAQMLPSDVRRIEGIDLIEVSEADPEGRKIKRIKSEHARRQIPLHGSVIEAGFLRYVQAARRERFVRLFPDLEPLTLADQTPVYSRGFSTKVWPRYRESVGVDNPRKPFHSLRHTFKAELKRRGIAYPEQDALLGHGPPLNAGAAYAAGVQIGLARRAEIIRDLSFEGFPASIPVPEDYGLDVVTQLGRYRAT